MGCMGFMLFLFITLGVVAWLGYSHYQTVMDRYERLGYRKVVGKHIVVEDRITEPTIFIARSVTIKNGSDRGVALMCINAEIDGHIVGNVHFKGGALTVKRGALLDLDLDMMGFTLNQYGMVKGEITGSYSALHRKSDPEEQRLISTNQLPDITK